MIELKFTNFAFLDFLTEPFCFVILPDLTKKKEDIHNYDMERE